MTTPTVPAAPALVTIAGVDILATGTWNLSTGPATFTTEDLAAGVEAAQCPSVGPPVLKLGHVDPRFDGEPAVGRVVNMALTAEGNKIAGDLAGLPGWLAEVMPSAYPERSIEGSWDFVCQQGHAHPFVITAVALLGVARPGVGVLSSLSDVADLYGVAAAADPGTVWKLDLGGGPMTSPDGAVKAIRAYEQGKAAAAVVMAAGVTTEDVRRAYRDSGVSWDMWICEMQIDPPQLIVCDDSTSKVFRVPVTIKGTDVTFGDAVEVEVEYVDVAAAAGVRRVVFASAEESRAGAVPSAAGEAASEAEPEPGAEAGGPHAAYTGTHSHPHAAMGAQGDDTTHDHSHTHAGDAIHAHAHASAAGPATKGAEMDFSDEQMAALRTRLGLAEDADLTAEQVMAALAEQPEPVSAGAGRLPSGVVAVDRDVWEETQARIRKGEQAREAQLRTQRDDAIAAAVAAGKFPVARVRHWEQVWDSNPDATREVLAGLTSGVVPTKDIGDPGGDMAELDPEYAGLFPPEPAARRPA